MAKRKSLYGVHPAVAMVQKWIADLKSKTGKSLDEWMKHIKKEGPPTEAERRDWLKATHGLGSNSVWWLAERSVGKGGDEDSPEAYKAYWGEQLEKRKALLEKAASDAGYLRNREILFGCLRNRTQFVER